MNQLPSPSKLSQKHIVVLAVIGTALLGIFIASRIDVSPSVEQAANGLPASRQPLITKIEFGIVAGEATGLLPAATAVRQTRNNEYKTTDQFGMKVTTTDEAREPVRLHVRLLDTNQRVIQLNPETATFSPGTSVFCCWRIQETGSFTLQVFRPEGTITSIPLNIESAL